MLTGTRVATYKKALSAVGVRGLEIILKEGRRALGSEMGGV
jgi:hypothetical protein